MKIHRKSWLKQLSVLVSTKASMPYGSSPQNSRTNFVDLRHSFCNFKIHENFSKACIIKTTKSSKTSLTCLELFMQNDKVGEGDVFFKENDFIAFVA
jgi:hypothetical protein